MLVSSERADGMIFVNTFRWLLVWNVWLSFQVVAFVLNNSIWILKRCCVGKSDYRHLILERI